MTINDIITIVCNYFCIIPDLVIRSNKIGPEVEARQVIHYFCHELKAGTFAEIGRQTNRTHATVIHSVKTVIDRMASERSFKGKIDEIRCKITGVDNLQQDTMTCILDDFSRILSRLEALNPPTKITELNKTA